MVEADHIERNRREWYGSLYVGDNGEVCLPAEMIEAAIIKGSMKMKRGPASKAGILVEKNAALEYDGPRAPAELWQDERFVFRSPARVGTSKVMRTRPRFPVWGAIIEVQYLPSLLNGHEIFDFLRVAGEQIGVGDWRPRFGRFTVEPLDPTVLAEAPAAAQSPRPRGRPRKEQGEALL